MTDREILELAAKAAGYVFVWDYDRHFDGPAILQQGFPIAWDPIEDDGDCARMESAIGIDVYWHEDCVCCMFNGFGFTRHFGDHDDDKDAARRYASTRVAVLIGKAMP